MRKLNDEEIKELWEKLNSILNPQSKKLNSFIKGGISQFFNNSNPYLVDIHFNSEYDDSGYQVELGAIIVYDKDMNEIVPDKNKSLEWRNYLEKYYIEYANSDEEVPNDYKLYLNNDLPNLYLGDE